MASGTGFVPPEPARLGVQALKQGAFDYVTKPIDPNQLFYLRSRGIDALTARNMLCLGFAGEVLDTIDVPVLRELADSRLVAMLGDATVAAE